MCNMELLLKSLNISEEKFDKLLKISHNQFKLNYRDLIFLEHYENIAVKFTEDDILEFYRHSDNQSKFKLFNFNDWKDEVINVINDNVVNTAYKRCPFTNELIRTYYEIFSDDLDITLSENEIKVKLILPEMD